MEPKKPTSPAREVADRGGTTGQQSKAEMDIAEGESLETVHVEPSMLEDVEPAANLRDVVPGTIHSPAHNVTVMTIEDRRDKIPEPGPSDARTKKKKKSKNKKHRNTEAASDGAEVPATAELLPSIPIEDDSLERALNVALPEFDDSSLLEEGHFPRIFDDEKRADRAVDLQSPDDLIQLKAISMGSSTENADETIPAPADTEDDAGSYFIPASQAVEELKCIGEDPPLPVEEVKSDTFHVTEQFQAHTSPDHGYSSFGADFSSEQQEPGVNDSETTKDTVERPVAEGTRPTSDQPLGETEQTWDHEVDSLDVIRESTGTEAVAHKETVGIGQMPSHFDIPVGQEAVSRPSFSSDAPNRPSTVNIPAPELPPAPETSKCVVREAEQPLDSMTENRDSELPITRPDAREELSQVLRLNEMVIRNPAAKELAIVEPVLSEESAFVGISQGNEAELAGSSQTQVTTASKDESLKLRAAKKKTKNRKLNRSAVEEAQPSEQSVAADGAAAPVLEIVQEADASSGYGSQVFQKDNTELAPLDCEVPIIARSKLVSTDDNAIELGTPGDNVESRPTDAQPDILGQQLVSTEESTREVQVAGDFEKRVDASSPEIEQVDQQTADIEETFAKGEADVAKTDSSIVKEMRTFPGSGSPEKLEPQHGSHQILLPASTAVQPATGKHVREVEQPASQAAYTSPGDIAKTRVCSDAASIKESVPKPKKPRGTMISALLARFQRDDLEEDQSERFKPQPKRMLFPAPSITVAAQAPKDEPIPIVSAARPDDHSLEPKAPTSSLPDSSGRKLDEIPETITQTPPKQPEVTDGSQESPAFPTSDLDYPLDARDSDTRIPDGKLDLNMIPDIESVVREQTTSITSMAATDAQVSFSWQNSLVEDESILNRQTEESVPSKQGNALASLNPEPCKLLAENEAFSLNVQEKDKSLEITAPTEDIELEEQPTRVQNKTVQESAVRITTGASGTTPPKTTETPPLKEQELRFHAEMQAEDDEIILLESKKLAHGKLHKKKQKRLNELLARRASRDAERDVQKTSPVSRIGISGCPKEDELSTLEQSPAGSGSSAERPQVEVEAAKMETVEVDSRKQHQALGGPQQESLGISGLHPTYSTRIKKHPLYEETFDLTPEVQIEGFMAPKEAFESRTGVDEAQDSPKAPQPPGASERATPRKKSKNKGMKKSVDSESVNDNLPPKTPEAANTFETEKIICAAVSPEVITEEPHVIGRSPGEFIGVAPSAPVEYELREEPRPLSSLHALEASPLEAHVGTLPDQALRDDATEREELPIGQPFLASQGDDGLASVESSHRETTEPVIPLTKSQKKKLKKAKKASKPQDNKVEADQPAASTTDANHGAATRLVGQDLDHNELKSLDPPALLVVADAKVFEPQHQEVPGLNSVTLVQPAEQAVDPPPSTQEMPSVPVDTDMPASQTPSAGVTTSRQPTTPETIQEASVQEFPAQEPAKEFLIMPATTTGEPVSSTDVTSSQKRDIERGRGLVLGAESFSRHPNDGLPEYISPVGKDVGMSLESLPGELEWQQEITREEQELTNLKATKRKRRSAAQKTRIKELEERVQKLSEKAAARKVERLKSRELDSASKQADEAGPGKRESRVTHEDPVADEAQRPLMREKREDVDQSAIFEGLTEIGDKLMLKSPDAAQRVQDEQPSIVHQTEDPDDDAIAIPGNETIKANEMTSPGSARRDEPLCPVAKSSVRSEVQAAQHLETFGKVSIIEDWYVSEARDEDQLASLEASDSFPKLEVTLPEPATIQPSGEEYTAPGLADAQNTSEILNEVTTLPSSEEPVVAEGGRENPKTSTISIMEDFADKATVEASEDARKNNAKSRNENNAKKLAFQDEPAEGSTMETCTEQLEISKRKLSTSRESALGTLMEPPREYRELDLPNASRERVAEPDVETEASPDVCKGSAPTFEEGQVGEQQTSAPAWKTDLFAVAEEPEKTSKKKRKKSKGKQAALSDLGVELPTSASRDSGLIVVPTETAEPTSTETPEGEEMATAVESVYQDAAIEPNGANMGLTGLENSEQRVMEPCPKPTPLDISSSQEMSDGDHPLVTEEKVKGKGLSVAVQGHPEEHSSVIANSPAKDACKAPAGSLSYRLKVWAGANSGS